MFRSLFELNSDREARELGTCVDDVDVVATSESVIKQVLHTATEPITTLKQAHTNMLLKATKLEAVSVIDDEYREQVMSKIEARLTPPNNETDVFEARGEAIIGGWPLDPYAPTEVDATRAFVEKFGNVDIGHQLYDIILERVDA